MHTDWDSDRAKYIASQSAAVAFPAGQSGNVPSGVTIGPSYFNNFGNFPSAKYILDLPLAANNISNTVALAKAAYASAKSQISAFQIGNEPQGYKGTVRSSSYTPQNYVSEFTSFSNAVSNALGISSNTPIYDAIGLGSPGAYETSDQVPVPGAYYPSNLFPAGLRALVPRFQSVSLHYYQTRANGDQATQLRNELMNHGITTSKTSFFTRAIQYFHTNYPNIKVNLAEVASSLNGATNAYGLEQTFGSTLWQVDWMLYCASIGINRINWQQISASAFDLWQPVVYRGRQPGVLPPFYAMVFVADFISTNGPVRIKNIDLNDDHLAAYAVYGPGGRLNRSVLVNLNYFVGPESASNVRAITNFVLTPPVGVTSVVVKRLTAPGALAAAGSDGSNDQGNGITWAGQRWTYESRGEAQTVKSDTTTLPVVNGKVTVPVKASEAVMVSGA